jgi:hypothetical protein
MFSTDFVFKLFRCDLEFIQYIYSKLCLDFQLESFELSEGELPLFLALT